MRVRNRSVIIMVGQGVSQAAAIAAGIILVRLISQEVYGTYRQVLLVYMSVSALLSLQLDQSLYYFVPKAASDARRALAAQTLTTAWGLALLTSAIMFVGAGPIADFFENPPLEGLLRIFSLFPFAESISMLIPAFMIGLDRPVRSTVYVIAKSVIRFVVVLAVFNVGSGIESVLWVLIASSALVALIGGVDMVRLGGGAFRIQGSMLVEQLRYALPLWLGTITGALSVQYDKLLISRVFDTATFAVYFCGAIQIPVVMLVTTSITAAIMPSLVTILRSGEMGDALGLWQEATRKASLIVLPAFAFLLPVSRDFMVLLYGVDYAAAAGPFAVYLLMLPIRVAVYATLFRALGVTRPVAVCGVIGVTVNVILSTGLVYLGRGTYLAFIGPSIGTVLAEASAASYLLWRLRDTTGVPISRLMRWSELGRTLLLCAVAGVVIYVLPLIGLPVLPLAAKLAVQGAVFTVILVCAGLATGHLNVDERELLLTIGRRVLRLPPRV